MKTSIDCLPCFVRQTLDAARRATHDPAVHEALLREVLRWMSEMDFSISPPELAQRIHRRLRKITGVEDPYQEEKKAHNRLALECIPDLEKTVQQSDDPLLTATRISIAGNLIDLGAKSGLKDTEILDAIEHATRHPLVGKTDPFRTAIQQAESILYLADNAGEIVFDRLLIEQLGPERVTVAVRGKPILNDATRIDAKTAGLDDLVRIIDNGSDAPGTLLNECSEEFKNCFEQADLILAKGQGNFETLSDDPHNIFFLLNVKCPVVANQTGVPVGTNLVWNKGTA